MRQFTAASLGGGDEMIESQAKWAQCENCGMYLVGHPSDSYRTLEVFCSLKCNQEYSGDDDDMRNEESK